MRGVKKLLDTPREVTRVVRRDARIKVKDKKVGRLFFSCNPCLFFLLSTLPVGEKESDGDDSQCPRKFDNGCGFEGITLVKAIPGAGCGGYRGSIIDRSPCKEGEAVIG